jgi:hypothetical protein
VRLRKLRLGCVKVVGRLQEVEYVHVLNCSTFAIAKGVRCRRRTRCAWRGIDNGDGAAVCVGRILNIGTAGDKCLRGVVLLGAVILLGLAFGFLFFVELALVFLGFGDAALRATGQLCARIEEFSASQHNNEGQRIVKTALVLGARATTAAQRMRTAGEWGNGARTVWVL